MYDHLYLDLTDTPYDKYVCPNCGNKFEYDVWSHSYAGDKECGIGWFNCWKCEEHTVTVLV